MYNKLVSAISHQVSCPCLIDISAAFDTIDYNIIYYSKDCLSGLVLLTLLSSGFNHISLLAPSPYKTSKASSKSYPLTCDVPQGSVLGPLLFLLYTTSFSSLLKAS